MKTIYISYDCAFRMHRALLALLILVICFILFLPAMRFPALLFVLILNGKRIESSYVVKMQFVDLEEFFISLCNK